MEDFIATHGLHETGQSLAVETGAPLPEDLTAILNQAGGNTYANGFFRFVAPQSMRPYLALFNLHSETRIRLFVDVDHESTLKRRPITQRDIQDKVEFVFSAQNVDIVEDGVQHLVLLVLIEQQMSKGTFQKRVTLLRVQIE